MNAEKTRQALRDQIKTIRAMLADDRYAGVNEEAVRVLTSSGKLRNRTHRRRPVVILIRGRKRCAAAAELGGYFGERRHSGGASPNKSWEYLHEINHRKSALDNTIVSYDDDADY